MNSTKLTQLHVYIIGGVLMLLLGVGLFFALIKPIDDANKVLATQIATVEGQQASIDGENFTIMPTWDTQREKATEKLKQVTQRQANKAAQLASLERRKQVPAARQIHLGDGSQTHLLRVTMPRWLNLPGYVVQNTNAYARARAARRGVKIETAFSAPAPTTDPTQIPPRVIAWNLGAITATGEFPRVMQWFEDWSSAPLLAAVDGLKCSLSGRNGEITATGTLIVYVFPTGQPATNPAAAGATPAAPGAAGGFGPPGGYPGAAGGPPGGYPGAPGA